MLASNEKYSLLTLFFHCPDTLKLLNNRGESIWNDCDHDKKSEDKDDDCGHDELDVSACDASVLFQAFLICKSSS